MTCYQEIVCPECGSNQITKSGRTEQGTQRYRRQNAGCSTRTFLLDYRYKACVPGIKRPVVEMAINGSGILNTGRVLGINKNTVISTLKKSNPSYVGKKSEQCWLWYTIDHATRTILAHVFGKRKNDVFKQLKALLKPFNIARYYPDDWGACERHLDTGKHEAGTSTTLKK